MDTKQMLELVERYEQNRDFITNEETVKMALVVPFVQMLGYDPKSPREVRLEYSADFVQGDGKRYADRMDFAIFDHTGAKPLLVIETKPLGTDLPTKCQQLARYIAQLPELHFGIITDGCHYLFYGDLENNNQMDAEPFFSFSLDDPKSDWGKICKFLDKFSRDSFNAETLVTDAENSRYRQAMIDKIAAALRAPQDDESFMKWLTEDIYKGKRTSGVMARLGDVAREAIEPALLRLMSDDFLTKLRRRIDSINQGDDEAEEVNVSLEAPPAPVAAKDAAPAAEVETTEEELKAFELVQGICTHHGASTEDVIYKDTLNYFNVSFQKPTKWFVRLFTRGKRPSITTRVPLEEARSLVTGFDVEEAPATFGVSRVYLNDVSQLWAVKDLVLRSLDLARGAADQASEPSS